jgi:hypothetical protein
MSAPIPLTFTPGIVRAAHPSLGPGLLACVPASSAGIKLCSACHVEQLEAEFSRAQLKKHGQRKCRACCAGKQQLQQQRQSRPPPLSIADNSPVQELAEQQEQKQQRNKKTSRTASSRARTNKKTAAPVSGAIIRKTGAASAAARNNKAPDSTPCITARTEPPPDTTAGQRTLRLLQGGTLLHSLSLSLSLSPTMRRGPWKRNPQILTRTTPRPVRTLPNPSAQ